MLSPVLDVFRLRQYFNVVTRSREVVAGVREDAGLLDSVRRALVPLPFDRRPTGEEAVFGPLRREPVDLGGRRLGVVATGGSGALASVVGVARALEEAALDPAVISVCSGSALFGFPVAAGIEAEEVARFVVSLGPDDYVDVDWGRILTLLPRLGRGFAGVIRGERLEATYRELLGDRTLGELAVPCYAPIWNVEENRVEYLGPRTHPEVTVARAVRMAVALPLFIDPVPLAGSSWCDGGLVDIFPVHPVLDLEPACDAFVAVNGFYPPGFVGEDATGWRERTASILHVASQVRTCQQVELARENLARLHAAGDVAMIEPVPYDTVRGIGFYRQFLETADWADFMLAGRDAARAGLRDLAAATAVAAPRTRSAPA